MRPIAILYEHPEWFVPLFAELEKRELPFERLHVGDLTWDPKRRDTDYSLIVNRMSPSAWRRGGSDAIFGVLNYLEHLDSIGAKVVNGQEAYRYEISKARQLSLLAALGIPHPKSRVITGADQAVSAARGLRFPVLVKPNVGGSGAGINSFETPEELAEVVTRGDLWLGPDHTALVQEHLRPEGDVIVRVEILSGELLYAIELDLEPGSFNLCPADYCRTDGDGVSGRGLPVRAIDPPFEVVQQARRIVSAAGMDVGGVEYLVDADDGETYFYDLNALSNFVADAPAVVGFDPFLDLVDLFERHEKGHQVAQAGLAS